MTIERALVIARPASLTRSVSWNSVRLGGPIALKVRASRQQPASCSLASQVLRREQPLGALRTFTTTSALAKKGGKAARDSSPSAAVEDPADFTTLNADIAAVHERLKEELSKLSAGGRFNHELLESLRVQPDKTNKRTVKLSDVAQVVPRGRTVQIMVGENDHLKPVTSAIQSSNLSLTPQPDPTGTNPLLLIVNIPPPTAESRQAVLEQAKQAGMKASTGVKEARAKQQKTIRTMEKNKAARPDDAKKAGEKMEKVVEKASAEVKKVVDQARKNLESG